LQLCGQTFAALGSAAGKHPAALLGSHALPEAVNFLSLAHFRLVCSLHFVAPLAVVAYARLMKAVMLNAPKGAIAQIYHAIIYDSGNACQQAGFRAYPI